MEKKKTLTSAQIADAERLKALYEAKKKELGITQQSIADMLNISQGGVGHYLNGRNALNAAVAAVFARALQVDVSDFSPSLAKEISAMSAAATSNAKYVGQYAPGIKYPVLSKIQAGNWSEACEPYALKDIDLWLESDAHIQGEAFWLLVEGESMTAPVGLSIPEGTYVLF
ncbi:helix-turn-helix domain-containing protein, partial [Klebsiella pneumoniae]